MPNPNNNKNNYFTRRLLQAISPTPTDVITSGQWEYEHRNSPHMEAILKENQRRAKYIGSDHYVIQYDILGRPELYVDNGENLEKVPEDLIPAVLQNSSKLYDAWQDTVGNKIPDSPTISQYNGPEHSDFEREQMRKQYNAAQYDKRGKEALDKAMTYTMPSTYTNMIGNYFDWSVPTRTAVGLGADIGPMLVGAGTGAAAQIATKGLTLGNLLRGAGTGVLRAYDPVMSTIGTTLKLGNKAVRGTQELVNTVNEARRMNAVQRGLGELVRPVSNSGVLYSSALPIPYNTIFSEINKFRKNIKTLKDLQKVEEAIASGKKSVGFDTKIKGTNYTYRQGIDEVRRNILKNKYKSINQSLLSDQVLSKDDVLNRLKMARKEGILDQQVPESNITYEEALTNKLESALYNDLNNSINEGNVDAINDVLNEHRKYFGNNKPKMDKAISLVTKNPEYTFKKGKIVKTTPSVTQALDNATKNTAKPIELANAKGATSENPTIVTDNPTLPENIPTENPTVLPENIPTEAIPVSETPTPETRKIHTLDGNEIEVSDFSPDNDSDGFHINKQLPYETQDGNIIVTANTGEQYSIPESMLKDGGLNVSDDFYVHLDNDGTLQTSQDFDRQGYPIRNNDSEPRTYIAYVDNEGNTRYVPGYYYNNNIGGHDYNFHNNLHSYYVTLDNEPKGGSLLDRAKTRTKNFFSRKTMLGDLELSNSDFKQITTAEVGEPIQILDKDNNPITFTKQPDGRIEISRPFNPESKPYLISDRVEIPEKPVTPTEESVVKPGTIEEKPVIASEETPTVVPEAKPVIPTEEAPAANPIEESTPTPVEEPTVAVRQEEPTSVPSENTENVEKRVLNFPNGKKLQYVVKNNGIYTDQGSGILIKMDDYGDVFDIEVPANQRAKYFNYFGAPYQFDSTGNISSTKNYDNLLKRIYYNYPYDKFGSPTDKGKLHSVKDWFLGKSKEKTPIDVSFKVNGDYVVVDPQLKNRPNGWKIARHILTGIGGGAAFGANRYYANEKKEKLENRKKLTIPKFEQDDNFDGLPYATETVDGVNYVIFDKSEQMDGEKVYPAYAIKSDGSYDPNGDMVFLNYINGHFHLPNGRTYDASRSRFDVQDVNNVPTDTTQVSNDNPRLGTQEQPAPKQEEQPKVKQNTTQPVTPAKGSDQEQAFVPYYMNNYYNSRNQYMPWLRNG